MFLRHHASPVEERVVPRDVVGMDDHRRGNDRPQPFDEGGFTSAAAAVDRNHAWTSSGAGGCIEQSLQNIG